MTYQTPPATAPATASDTPTKLEKLYYSLDNAFSYQANALELAYELLGETNDPFFDEVIVTLEQNCNTFILQSLYDNVCQKIKGSK